MHRAVETLHIQILPNRGIARAGRRWRENRDHKVFSTEFLSPERNTLVTALKGTLIWASEAHMSIVSISGMFSIALPFLCFSVDLSKPVTAGDLGRRWNRRVSLLCQTRQQSQNTLLSENSPIHFPQNCFLGNPRILWSSSCLHDYSSYHLNSCTVLFLMSVTQLLKPLAERSTVNEVRFPAPQLL